MQNQYNLAHRGDDALVDTPGIAQGIAYVPYFPSRRVLAVAVIGAIRKWPRD